MKALQEGFSLQELDGWTWEALLVRRIVFHQFVEQFAVFGNPGGVAIIGNGGKDLFETLNQLASMLIQWEVQQWAWDSASLVKIAHWSLADEDGSAKILEFGEKSTDGVDVLLTDRSIEPLHFIDDLLNNDPVVAHERAGSITEVGEEIKIGTVSTVEGLSGDKSGLVVGLALVDVRVTRVSIGFFLT